MLINNRNVKEKVLTLNIIGDGELKKELESLCRDLNIGDYVNFYGYLPNDTVREYYRKSLFVVAPSIKEPFGTVALEAMIEKVCIIATKVEGFPEMIRDRRDGLLVSPNNVQELYVAMKTLVNDEDLRKTLSHNGYNRVSSNFIWEKTAEKMRNIYEKVDKENL